GGVERATAAERTPRLPEQQERRERESERRVPPELESPPGPRPGGDLARGEGGREREREPEEEEASLRRRGERAAQPPEGTRRPPDLPERAPGVARGRARQPRPRGEARRVDQVGDREAEEEQRPEGEAERKRPPREEEP